MKPLNHTPNQQRGGFGLGLIVGLLLGLAVALGVALYVTKVPIPFVDKVPQRSAEQDEAEARANKNWNPNAPLSTGNTKPVRPAASGVVGGADSNGANAPTTVLPPSGGASAALGTATTAATPTARPASAPTTAATQAAITAAAGAATKPVIDPSNPQNKDRFVFFVQAGAFVQPAEAEQQRARLAMQGFTARVYERENQGRVLYRVRIGPFDGEAEAEKLKADVEGAGLEAALVRVQR